MPLKLPSISKHLVRFAIQLTSTSTHCYYSMACISVYGRRGSFFQHFLYINFTLPRNLSITAGITLSYPVQFVLCVYTQLKLRYHQFTGGPWRSKIASSGMAQHQHTDAHEYSGASAGAVWYIAHGGEVLTHSCLSAHIASSLTLSAKCFNAVQPPPDFQSFPPLNSANYKGHKYSLPRTTQVI